MDGWGSNEKYPHALGEPATSINRWYLKLKSEIMPMPTLSPTRPWTACP